MKESTILDSCFHRNDPSGSLRAGRFMAGMNAGNPSTLLRIDEIVHRGESATSSPTVYRNDTENELKWRII